MRSNTLFQSCRTKQDTRVFASLQIWNTWLKLNLIMALYVPMQKVDQTQKFSEWNFLCPSCIPREHRFDIQF